MNLHAMASAAIGRVNPMQGTTLQKSTGYTTNSDGTRVPTYSTPVDVRCQVQALTQSEISTLNGLGIEDCRRKVYLSGKVAGAVRADRRGGDLLRFADGTLWLVVSVMEQWPDWVCVAIVQQNGA